MSADGGEPKDVTPGDRDALSHFEHLHDRRQFHLLSGWEISRIHGRRRTKEEAWSTNYEHLPRARCGRRRRNGNA